jgi:DNA repair protein RadC
MAKNVRVKSANLGAKDPVQAKGLAEGNPHYYGHRERLRSRFREAGTDALPDYELL